jgi:hypothetical protein
VLFTYARSSDQATHRLSLGGVIRSGSLKVSRSYRFQDLL